MTELKPCPFCRQTSSMVVNAYNNVFWVLCRKCMAIGPAAGTKEAAIDNWNKRS